MQYRSVLFDFDYTLADATDGIVQSYNETLLQYGYPAQSVESIRKTVGMTVEDALLLFCGSGTDPEKIAQMRKYFKGRADEVMLGQTALLPSTRPLFDYLQEKGVRFGIVTTKMRKRVEDFFAREGLLGRLGVIIGVDDAPLPKPDPSGLLKAIGALSGEPAASLYVGDHSIDAKTAGAAGVDFAAVLTGTTSRSDFYSFSCRYILNDAGGLQKIPGIF